jgi:hypothetical protein
MWLKDWMGCCFALRTRYDTRNLPGGSWWRWTEGGVRWRGSSFNSSAASGARFKGWKWPRSGQKGATSLTDGRGDDCLAWKASQRCSDDGIWKLGFCLSWPNFWSKTCTIYRAFCSKISHTSRTLSPSCLIQSGVRFCSNLVEILQLGMFFGFFLLDCRRKMIAAVGPAGPCTREWLGRDRIEERLKKRLAWPVRGEYQILAHGQLEHRKPS